MVYSLLAVDIALLHGNRTNLRECRHKYLLCFLFADISFWGEIMEINITDCDGFDIINALCLACFSSEGKMANSSNE